MLLHQKGKPTLAFCRECPKLYEQTPANIKLHQHAEDRSMQRRRFQLEIAATQRLLTEEHTG